MEKRTALVFGATGLVGRSLVSKLLLSDTYSEIRIFTRKGSGFSSARLTEVISDLKDINSLSAQISGDDLYICLGTTIRKAGSVRAMEQIDRDLPVAVAGLAKTNGVKRIAVVSSIGLDPY